MTVHPVEASRPGPGDVLLSLAVIGLIVLLFATWLPQYLTWPWWVDLDDYAAIAQGWERGILPYRDVSIFNFPGQIYLFRLLGRAFGWGHTAPIYAVDAGLLVVLVIALAGWSRRVLGGALPGLIGGLALVAYYCDQDYAMVAQRDWHGPVLAVLAMLMVQAVRGRMALSSSALLFAAGFTIRPHIVLFVPAVLMALAGTPKRDGEARPVAGAWIGWGFLLGVYIALAFLPLYLEGLLPDLLRGVRVARYGGTFAQKGPRDIATQLIHLVRDERYLLIALANLAMAARLGREAVRVVLPWVVALAFALIYPAIHPVNHKYLNHPPNLFFSLNLALFAWLVIESFRDRAAARWLVALAVLALAINRWPAYCSPRTSLDAIEILRRGEIPEKVPPGASGWFPSTAVGNTSLAKYGGYSWADYRATLLYLRENTGPETRVANALKRDPFPPVNGPTGRLTPWPCEAGMPYLFLVRGDTEARFARALETAEDSVVVWVPGETMYAVQTTEPTETPLLDRAIRDHFVPGAKFGLIEVWRRRTSADPG